MDSEKYNPFDFVAIYKRLEKERDEKKKNALLNKDSTLNKKSDCNEPSTSTGHSVNTEDSSGTESSSPSKNTRSATKAKPNFVEPQTAKRRRYQPQTDNCKVIGPVICIGDFDDGYNMPPPLAPPTQKPPSFDPEIDAIIARHLENKYKCENEIYEDDVDTLNRVVNVKVYWRKMRTYKFPIRRFQSIESIYEHFAKLEDIDKSQVNLKLRNKTLSMSDTPKSIRYKIYHFIDGEIEFYKSPYDKPEVPEVIEGSEEEEEEEEVKFCIKQKDVKHPFFMSINKTENMIILYIKISEKLGIDVDSFTLIFDGEKIKHSDNMESLELEGDECFDLFKKQT